VRCRIFNVGMFCKSSNVPSVRFGWLHNNTTFNADKAPVSWAARDQARMTTLSGDPITVFKREFRTQSAPRFGSFARWIQSWRGRFASTSVSRFIHSKDGAVICSIYDVNTMSVPRPCGSYVIMRGLLVWSIISRSLSESSSSLYAETNVCHINTETRSLDTKCQ